jgi:hypothetical protein
MKTTLLLVASLALGACSVAARSPDMYRDDTGKALAAKQDAIHSCYDTVLHSTPGVGGHVTVKFEIDTEQGKISHVTVDKANTTAPDAVADCVTRHIEGVTLAPPDARKGEGSWTYEFQAPPASAPTPASAPEKT